MSLQDECSKLADCLSDVYIRFPDYYSYIKEHIKARGYRIFRNSVRQHIVQYKFTEDIDNLNSLDGIDFEKYCADLLKCNGFENVDVTPGSGDYGVDIIGIKQGEKYAFQCKRYSNKVGIAAIQEVFSGAKYYHCDRAVVITNSSFTRQAISFAKKVDVELWGREQFEKMLVNLSSSAEENARILVLSLQNTIRDIEQKKQEEQRLLKDRQRQKLEAQKRQKEKGFQNKQEEIRLSEENALARRINNRNQLIAFVCFLLPPIGITLAYFMWPSKYATTLLILFALSFSFFILVPILGLILLLTYFISIFVIRHKLKML